MIDSRVYGSLSVVIPVYNEAGVIEEVVRDFNEKVIKKIPDTRFIIAEDGSTDGTKEILSRLNKEILFKLVSGKERKGYAKAFKDALSAVETEFIFFSDSDGQHDPQDIFKLIEEIGDNDIVGGYKSPRRDPILRIIISKAYNSLVYLLFGLKLRDIDSGFKLIRKNVVDNILEDITSMQYCVMSEFILKAYLCGYKIKEIPVTHYSRKSGKTGIFSLTALPRIITKVIRSLFKIKFSYTRRKNR